MTRLFTVIHRDTQDPVIPFDCNPNSDDEGMLVYRSQQAAESAARHQSNLYSLDAIAAPLADVLIREALR